MSLCLRRGLCKKLLCLLLIAFPFPFRVNGAIQIVGEVEVRANGTKQVLPFEIKLGSSCQIKTTAKLPDTVEFITGFEDQDCYHLKRIRTESDLKEFGWVAEGAHPVQHYGSGQFLWLALCSGTFLDQLTKTENLTSNEFPIFDCFRKNPAFYHDDIRVRIVRDNGRGELPKEVEFSGPPYVVDGKGKRTDLKEGRFLAAKYDVTRMTNRFGLNLPLEFRLVRYLPPGFKMTDTGSSVAEEFSGRVQSVETIDEPASFLPEFKTSNVEIIDSRFSNVTRGPELGYTSTNKQWLKRTDARLQEIVRLQKEHPKQRDKPQTISKTVKMVVGGLLVASFLGFIILAVSMHRFSKESEA